MIATTFRPLPADARATYTSMAADAEFGMRSAGSGQVAS